MLCPGFLKGFFFFYFFFLEKGHIFQRGKLCKMWRNFLCDFVARKGEAVCMQGTLFHLLQVFYTALAVRFQHDFSMACYLGERSVSSRFCSEFDFVKFGTGMVLQLANISESALI